MKRKTILGILAVLVLFAALAIPAYADDPFDELVAANNDTTVQDFDFNGKGQVTVRNDIEIRSDLNIAARGTELVIPDGVTVTLHGRMQLIGFHVQSGGNLTVEGDDARLSTWGRPFHEDGSLAFEVDGTLAIIHGGDLVIGLGQWSNIDRDNIQSYEGGHISVTNDIRDAAALTQDMTELANTDVPEHLSDYTDRRLQVYVPWTVDADVEIPDGINVFVFNNGGGDETGSLTVNEGVQLSIPGNTNLAMCGSNLNVNGSIENYGRIELMTRNGGPDGTVPTFTLSEPAAYAGTGMIWVRSYDEHPEAYLTGFGENLTCYYSDDLGGQFRCIDTAALLAEFENFCDPDNDEGFYAGLCDIGTFTIPAGKNILIPEGKRVNIFGTELTIEAGATLDVQGQLECGNPVTVRGTLRVSGESWITDVNLHAGLTTPGSGVMSIENPNANVEISGAETINYDTFYSGLNVQLVNGSVTYGYIVRSLPDMNVVMTNVDRTDNRVRHELQLHDRDIAVTENLQVPENVTLHVDGNWGSTLSVSAGSTLTLSPGSGIRAYGSDIQINGMLVNNGEIRLGRTGNSDVANIILDQGSASYSGGGYVMIETHAYPKSHVVGMDPKLLFLQWESTDTCCYRIAAGEMHTLNSEFSFTLTTEDEGLGLGEYSKSWLVTPAADGWYRFTLSFPEGVSLTRRQARFGINGTTVQDCELITAEPDSMVFWANLRADEGYELVLSNIEDLGSLTATVTGSRVGSLADILQDMGARDGNYRLNIGEETTVTDSLTVPQNVTLYLQAPLTVENGGVFINRSDIIIQQNGSLTVAAGGSLQMVDAPDGNWFASVVLNGGYFTVNGQVVYDEGSCVVLYVSAYNNSFYRARGQIAGVDNNRIAVDEYSVFNQGDLSDALSSLTGYRSATLIFLNQNEETNFTLAQDLPGNYGFVLNGGVTLTVPADSEVDIEGWIALEFGDLVNNGTLNLNGAVNFQRSESRIINNGTLNLYGEITAETFHEDENPNPTGTILNAGHLVIFPDSDLADAVTVQNTASDVQTGILNAYAEILTLPEDLTQVESEAFHGTTAQVVFFPDGISSIGNQAFAACTDLQYAVIPAVNVTFGENIFTGCTNLILVGPLGGAAYDYAQANDIPFAVLN